MYAADDADARRCVCVLCVCRDILPLLPGREDRRVPRDLVSTEKCRRWYVSVAREGSAKEEQVRQRQRQKKINLGRSFRKQARNREKKEQREEKNSRDYSVVENLRKERRRMRAIK